MSACVYATQEELWEDLLYFALAQAQNERRHAQQVMPGANAWWSPPYRNACARAQLHLYNLAVREWPVDPMLVEMARAEGVL